MRIFKTKVFARWTRKEKLDDSDLLEAVREIENGLVEANLGGGLIKKRIAAQGRGKSGAYRTLIAYRSEERAVFLYGFPKSERDDIEKDEKKALKKLAKVLLSFSERKLDEAVENGALKEVTDDEKKA